MSNPTDSTDWLVAHTQGDSDARNRLMEQIYDRLKALASNYMQRERADHTLQTTALVHEAYLRMIEIDRIEWRDKAHFFAIAARQMRRVLVDHARGKRAKKRSVEKVELTDNLAITPSGLIDVLELNDALDRLADLSPRQAQVVELRFFSSMTVDETAEALAVSPRTVDGDWKVARAWLARELRE